MSGRRFLRSVLAVAALLAAAGAHAGRSCEARPLGVEALERGLTMAQRAHQALEAEHARTGAQVVVLARAGQDLSRYGLRYSHLGFAYRTDDGGSAAWRVVHKLNQCGTAEAALYRQGLAEFFLDDLWRMDAAWTPLSPHLQQRLLPILGSNAEAAQLHQRSYNLVSYPWSVRYQQSNQWLVETLAMAQPQPARDRPQAQAWLQQQGYVPTTLRLGPLTRLGGRVGSANVAFDDHPDEKRFAGRIETVTADSVFAWLERAGHARAPSRLVAEDAARRPS